VRSSHIAAVALTVYPGVLQQCKQHSSRFPSASKRDEPKGTTGIIQSGLTAVQTLLECCTLTRSKSAAYRFELATASVSWRLRFMAQLLTNV
jgi:hypothetical protein